MAAQGKKGFDFRMSKKVAELTQVVHMLFTRNHEKEVELEALKDAYEYEIELVQKDARSIIEKLQKDLEEAKKAASQHLDTSDLEDRYKKREDELKKKVIEIEGHLKDEKRECQGVRDLLIQAQKDIETLRQAHGEEISKWNVNTDSKLQEISKFKMQVTVLEKRLKETETSSNGIIMEMQRNSNRQQKELNHIKAAHQDGEKVKEQLIARNKQLELENRTLKKELSKNERRNSVASSVEVKEVREATAVDYVEEIERLRKEVQRYRNELLNREGNFNRMFVDQSPVLVDRKAGRMASSMDNSVSFRFSRERPSVYTPVSRRASIDVDDETSSVTFSRVGSGRLPHLHGEGRGRSNLPNSRLVKPKPLPRELLTTKVIRA